MIIHERLVCARPKGCGSSFDRITVDNIHVWGGPIFEDGNRTCYGLLTDDDIRDQYADCVRHLRIEERKTR